MNSYFSPSTIWVVKQRIWPEHVARITQMLKEYQILDCETDEDLLHGVSHIWSHQFTTDESAPWR